jgi:uncharacterized membrane protein YfcA
MSLLIRLGAGLVAGIAGGLFGISGGVVIVPTLVLGLAFTQHRAQGTSLAALAFPVAGLGAYYYWSEGQVDFVVAAMLALGFAIGHIVGSRVAHALSSKTMLRTFAVFLAALAVYQFSKAALVPGSADVGPLDASVSVCLGLAAVGTFAGVLGGLFGFGGGLVSVPIIVLAFGVPQHVAQGSALLALTLPVTIVSALHYKREGNVDSKSVLYIALGVFAGGAIGSNVALALDQAVMQRTFACFLLAIAVYLFVRKGAESPAP